MTPQTAKLEVSREPSIGCPDLATNRVAVVIVNYNSGEHLGQCLQSLARQTFRPHRILVVDNASADASLAAAERFPHVEVIRSAKNLGFAAANNLAIRRADDCRWVALVNADAFVAPNWLEQLIAASKRSRAGRFFFGVLLSADDPSKFDGTGDVYHVCGRAWRRDWGSSIAGPRSARPVLGACAAAALYDRAAFLEVGGFDEDYFCFYEDVDLSFRLRLSGYSGELVPDAVARHVGSGSTGKQSDFSVYHGHRNLVWTFVKNMPGGLFWCYLPQHLALNLATIVWFTLRGRPRVILRAKWDALRGLPAAWRKRREVQRRRVVSAGEIAALLAHGREPAKVAAKL